MSRFRDPAARDAAWGRYYRKRGLAPLMRKPQSRSNNQRLAVYAVRRALATLIRY
jgi:hypothetical protein